jgi:uncharacterized protein YmfQ (DUF2313 family)
MDPITGSGALVSQSAFVTGVGTVTLPPVGGDGSIISSPSTIGRPIPPPIPYPGDRHARRSGDDYADAQLGLLPRGQAWPRYEGSTLVQAITGIAEYWGAVDGRAADLLETESDPRATLELLPDWLRNWGIPDECIKQPMSIDEQRKSLVGKMTLMGAQSRNFFVAVAADIGYVIYISEYAPYMCGVSQVGDTRGQFNPSDPYQYRWQLGPEEMRFYWTVHVSGQRFVYFRCNGSQTGIDRLLLIGLFDDLECILRKWKPAHTDIIFDYSPWHALDYTTGFNAFYLPLGMP